MTDLEKLQAALRETTPPPNADAKAETLRLAAENFARLQESETAKRPISKAPPKGSLWKRTTAMFTFKSLRSVLYATSCIVVAGVVFTTYQPWDGTLTEGAIEDISAQNADLTNAEPALRLEGADAEEAPATEQDFGQLNRSSGYLAPRETAPKAAKPEAVGQLSASSELQSQTRQKQALAKTAKRTQPLAEAIVSPTPQSNNDQFAGAPENPVKITAQEPVSTFSIDVDAASYAYVRSTLLNGGHLRPDAVRIEEMVNYFTYDYATPSQDSEIPFTTQINVTQTPWNPDTQLVQIGIQGKKPALETRPPLNLVFLIDTSGSMQDPNKLPLLKQSFALMLTELRPTDQVAIVTYAGSAGTVLDPTNASETATILNALDNLNAGGSTAGGAGLRAAYALAEQMREAGEISRVLLATDGDFNVGINNPDDLKSFIETNRDSGTYLSVLGFGRGNYRDDMMQTLAQNGNGTAAYIDTLAEAQKTLVDQLSGALFPIANDVKIQVEFNPAAIAEYRLIGYETRALNREDFNNDRIDAGEIGAGHQVTALYEITPVGSPAILNDPLRYAAEASPSDNSEFGFFKLRYKSPGAANSTLITAPIKQADDKGQASFATAIAGFGQLLKGSNYTQSWSYEDAIALAETTKGTDPYGYRAEAIRLMKLANIRK